MTTYYVNNSTGDNGNAGTSTGAPWLTLQYAFSQLSAGDTLEIMEGTGTYTDNWSIKASNGCVSGTALNRITVTNYSTDLPAIRPTTNAQLELSYWTFDGIDLRQIFDIGRTAVGGAVVAYADYFTFKNGYLRHRSDAGIKLWATRYSIIDNNTFDNLRSRIASNDTTAIMLAQEVTNLEITNNTFTDIGSDGIQANNALAEQGDPDEIVIHDILIENNIFKVIDPYQYRDEDGTPAAEPTLPPDDFNGAYVGENGIDMKHGWNVTIRGNTFSGFRNTITNQDNSSANGAGCLLQDYFGNAFVDHGYHTVVEQNKFFDCQTGFELGAHSVDATNRGNFGVTLRNNLFFDDRRSPVDVSFDTGVDTYAHVLCRNNTGYCRIYHNSFDSADDTTRYLINIKATVSNISIKNNAFLNGVIATPSGLDWDYSAYTNDATVTFPAEAAGATLDISSADIGVSSATLQITSSSDVYNSGVSGLGVNNDYNNNPRPGSGASATAPDIGAYEVQDDSGGSVASATHTYSLRRKIATL